MARELQVSCGGSQLGSSVTAAIVTHLDRSRRASRSVFFTIIYQLMFVRRYAGAPHQTCNQCLAVGSRDVEVLVGIRNQHNQ